MLLVIVLGTPIPIDLLPVSHAGERHHRPKRKLPHRDTICVWVCVLTLSISQAIGGGFAGSPGAET